MPRNNWTRSEQIRAAAARIIEDVDPAIAGMRRASQVREILKLRRRLVAETGCDIGTTAHHITLGGVLRKLSGE